MKSLAALLFLGDHRRMHHPRQLLPTPMQLPRQALTRTLKTQINMPIWAIPINTAHLDRAHTNRLDKVCPLVRELDEDYLVDHEVVVTEELQPSIVHRTRMGAVMVQRNTEAVGDMAQAVMIHLLQKLVLDMELAATED